MSEEFSRQKIDTSRLPEAILMKWSPGVLEEGFVPFPKKLLRVLHKAFGTPHALESLAILLAIADYKRPSLSRDPSLDFLAFLAGLEPPKAMEILKKLESKGWIEMHTSQSGLDIKMEGFLNFIETLADTEEPS